MSIELTRLDPTQFRIVIAERQRDGFAATDIDPATADRLERLFHRPINVGDAVREIIAEVRTGGDAALREWTYRIDGVDVERSRVDSTAMAAAWDGLEQPVRNALSAAAQRLREFHAFQVDALDRGAGGAWLRPVPLGRVGCYVPGGRAAYPSTVLMSVIPAQVAGVEQIAVASPPAPSGGVHPLVAAAAHLLGVREVIIAGGAQAIAALAFGTESIDRVDKIVGPGNAFVTLAKHQVFGAVGIDQLAGPSEIVVIATAGADAEMVAADLISQLEHDPLAWAVCLTDDADLASAVSAKFAEAASDAARREIIGMAAGKHAAAVVCASTDEMTSLAAAFAPEHLSLQGTAAEALRDSVRNAGAVFVGAMSPVSIGDYIAGPNHTLPTQGAARYRGPLAVMDFIRWPSFVQLSDAEFDAVAPVAIRLAEAEGLAAHEQAIRTRTRVRQTS
jgi:histidinol dehydrogenase